MSDIILMEIHDGVAVITHSNDAKMNALSDEFQRGTRAFLAQVRRDKSINAVIFTARGRAFCAGADLSKRTSDQASDDHLSMGERASEAMQTVSNRLIMDFQELPVPVVCAINGVAAGAGVGLALAGDVTLAAESAYFYLPFLPRLGIVPDLGTTWFVERRIGRARSLGLALLGEKLGAQKAFEWGLIWACVPDAQLQEKAMQTAQKLAKLPPGAGREGRLAMDHAASNTLHAQLHYEASRQRDLLGTPAFFEGARSFMEKREPIFPARAI